MQRKRMDRWARALLADAGRGGLAGTAATVPMSAVMLALHELLPGAERLALPPRVVTEESAEAVGLLLDEELLDAVTVVTHLGYGGGTGALYGVLARRLPLPRPVSGIVFALLVWGLSYLGWIPAVGLMEPATEQPAGRNVMMVAAHVVWGAVLGALLPE